MCYNLNICIFSINWNVASVWVKDEIAKDSLKWVIDKFFDNYEVRDFFMDSP